MIRTLVFSAICAACASMAFQAPASAAPSPESAAHAPASAGVNAAAELVAANPAGTATLVVLIDYEDFGTQMLSQKLKEFARLNRDIKLVVRPLPQRGPLSGMTAKAAYAAARQGRFAQLHEAFLTDLGSHTWLSLRNSAPQVGLNWAQFQTDFDDPQVAAQVEANVQYAAGVNVKEIPAFVAGTQVFSDPWNKVDFARIAQEARAAKAAVTVVRDH